jgi:hypothetical protein
MNEDQYLHALIGASGLVRAARVLAVDLVDFWDQVGGGLDVAVGTVPTPSGPPLRLMVVLAPGDAFYGERFDRAVEAVHSVQSEVDSELLGTRP